MVNSTLKTFQIFFVLSAFLFSYAQDNPESVTKENVTVIVKYKTQPDKQEAAISSLDALIQQVKKEPHFVNIKMLVDPADKTNILLYEEWSDGAYYKGDHMNTPHLKNFIGEARNILAGPPDITFWQLKSNYILD